MRFKVSEKKTIWLNIEKSRIKWDETVSRGKNGQFGKFQKQVKDFLRPYWTTHVCYEEVKVPRSRMSLDFLNLTKRVAIEVSGKQHFEFVDGFFHKNRCDLWNQMKRDRLKEKFCELNDIKLIVIRQEDMPINEEFFEKRGLIL